jgi:hypothetical protein
VTTEPAEPDPLEGLTNPAGTALERVAIRTRESALTLSAWRLAVEADQGHGTIDLVETPGGGSLYRGDGLFLGWPQARLGAGYRLLVPGGGDPEPEALQLG